MHYIQKAMHKPMDVAPKQNVVFVTAETADQIYAREAAAQLTSMVAALDITARCVGVEILPTVWQKFRWTFYAIGLVAMFAVGGFSIGVLFDDVNPAAVVAAEGVSAPIYDRKDNYNSITGRTR